MRCGWFSMALETGGVRLRPMIGTPSGGGGYSYDASLCGSVLALDIRKMSWDDRHACLQDPRHTVKRRDSRPVKSSWFDHSGFQ